MIEQKKVAKKEETRAIDESYDNLLEQLKKKGKITLQMVNSFCISFQMLHLSIKYYMVDLTINQENAFTQILQTWGLGFDQKTALDLSTSVGTLALDLASFTNFAGYCCRIQKAYSISPWRWTLLDN